MQQLALNSPTGADLAVYTSTVGGRAKPKGIIHVNHGMAEHSARYARFAEALNMAGYHVIVQDHRGHGGTKAADAPLGVFASAAGAQKVLEDCRFVNAHAREAWPGLPVVWFGHSMGSIIGLNYCIRHSNTIDGAALWNSGVDGGALLFIYRTLLKAERMFKGSDVPSAVAHKLTFETWNRKFAPNRTEFDWLSRDKAEVDKYVADPLCGFPCSVGLWLDVTDMIATGASDRELGKIRKDLPMNLLGGAADPCTDGGKAMTRLAARLEKTGIGDLECAVLPDTRHESLNETNRDETTERFIRWVERVVG